MQKDQGAALVPVEPLSGLLEPATSARSLEPGRPSTGTAPPYRAVAASNDVEAIRAWLSLASGSPATFDSYRKEAERLLLWANRELAKALRELTHEDFMAYRRFLADPQPREVWVSGGGRKHKRGDPRWRPFSGPLAPSSQRQAELILNAMLSWLVEAGYLAGNPLALSKRRRVRPRARVTRYLTAEMWGDVKEYIELWPQVFPDQRAEAVRARWLFTVLYLGGLRLSEVLGCTMGDFYSEVVHGETFWWLTVVGKGNRERRIPVSDEFLTELAGYRAACGLSPSPHPAEVTPLLLPLRRTGRPLTRSAAHRIVKEVVARVAAWLNVRYPGEPHRAARLEAVSAHWLRHTAGSHMVDQAVELRTVRDNFGHASLSTTSIYVHTEDVARHRELATKHKIQWRTPATLKG